MSSNLQAFFDLELLSESFPSEPWSLTPQEAETGYLSRKSDDYARRLKQGRAAHPPLDSEAKQPKKELTTSQRVEALGAFTDRLLADTVPVSDRLIHLRHRAAELNLNLRDSDLQRKLWEARRRKAGAVEMFTSEMEEAIEEETWAWEGILMAGDSNLIAALPKVGKTCLLIEAIARWHFGAKEHLGCKFHGNCPPVIICGTDMPRRRWLKLLARFGLAEEVRPKVFRLVEGGPIVGLFSQDSPIYLDPTGISTMADLASKHPGALLLVDSYARCTMPLGLKEASSDYAGPLGDLQDAVAPYGVTVAAIHHSGHGRIGEGAVAACRGTSALPAAVSQVVALSWLNRTKGSADKRVVLQTEGRGGEPLQLLIEQQDSGWILHGDASEVFHEQQMAEVEETLQDRQSNALDAVRDRWAMDCQRTTSGDLIEAMELKGSSAPRIARRILQQLATRGLLQSSKEATAHGAVVWFWPAETRGGDTPTHSPAPLSPLSPLSPPPLESINKKKEIAYAGREGTPRTPRTEGTGGQLRPAKSPAGCPLPLVSVVGVEVDSPKLVALQPVCQNSHLDSESPGVEQQVSPVASTKPWHAMALQLRVEMPDLLPAQIALVLEQRGHHGILGRQIKALFAEHPQRQVA